MNKYCKIVLLFFLTFFGTSFSQVINTGQEFLISSFPSQNNREPFVLADNKSNFYVLWSSYFDIQNKEDVLIKKFSDNTQTIVNTTKINNYTLNTQNRPAAAINKKGDLVVAWASYEGEDTALDILVQMFNTSLVPKGTEFFANTTRTNSQNNPAVAVFDDGSFVVVWHSWSDNNYDRDIIGQKFDSNGEKIGNEFIINTFRLNSQAKPSIAILNDDKFVVSWESWKQEDTTKSNYGIYAQLFDKNCNKIGNEFLVNTYTDNDQFFSSVSSNSNGDFIIVWTSWEQDGDKGGIYAQRFSSDGSKIGNEFLVNTYTKNYQWLPKAVYFNNGSFGIVWSSWEQDGSRDGVIFQLFDKNAKKIGNEIIINTYKNNYQWEPSIAKLSEKELIIVWSSFGQVQNSYSIHGKKISIK